jgi:hypothetical protein
MFQKANDTKNLTAVNKVAVNKENFFKPFIQPKLTVNQPNDIYEQEADAMAEHVMRMTDNETSQQSFKPGISSIQKKCAHCEEEEKQAQRKIADGVIQRQPTSTTETSTTETEIPHLTLDSSSLFQSSSGPDFLALRQPFFNRHIAHLWDPDSALHVWQYNFNFFRRIGLSPDISTTLTNFTAPRFIDSQLKADNPTWWEITDRELNTSTIGGSVPVLEFDANFAPRAPSWFKSIFGGGGNRVQRKCADCEAEEKQMQRKESKTGNDNASSIENYINSIEGKGNQLSKKEKDFFEPRFGIDFSDVKIHHDAEAAASAQSVNAFAYTHGKNIVFDLNQYKPGTNEGKKLLAHELTHVVQQNGEGKIRRVPRPQSPGDLSSYNESTRQRITYDPDEISLNPALHFQQGIVTTPRPGFDIDYVFTGTIAAWLQPPLRSMARAIFALQQNDTDPVRINSTIIKALDLSSFHENNNSSGAAGPNTRFRFTCTEFDPSGSGSGRTRNVQIIIENIGLPQTIPNASETASQRIARFARDYGFTRVNDLLFSDTDFNKVLIAISLVPDRILQSIRNIPFDRVTGQDVGPQGEAAEYSWRNSGGTFTRVINIYDKALSSSTSAESLAFLMTHEIGHAIAHRPAEATGSAAQPDLSAATGRGSFRDAATSDGGLTRAITAYGRTGWGEYFAEAFSMFINEPDTLRLLRPHVYTYFTTKFPAQAASSQQQSSAQQQAPSAQQQSAQPAIQRKCTNEHERIANSNDPVAGLSKTENYISSLHGGNALNENEKKFFEQRMGYDFSEVKIHTNTAASESAKNINAQAYTHGNNIVFASGQYQPATHEGKKLLAHELTHIVQQNGYANSNRLQRKAEFKKEKPVKNINLAERFAEANEKGESSSHFGKTDPTINGADLTQKLTGNPIKLPAESDIQSTPATKYSECSFSKVPDNITSYKMWIPSNSTKWKYESDIKRVKNLFGKKNCSNSIVTIILTGDPDSKTVYANTKTHEEVHASHTEQLHKSVIEPFDKDISSIKMKGNDDDKCKKNLLKYAEVKAKNAWTDFVNGFNTLAKDFHDKPAGHNGIMGVSDIDTDCQWIKVKGKE